MSDTPQSLLTTSRFRVERICYGGHDNTDCHREVVRHPGAVAILPIIDEERICLIRNYRPAVDQTLIELPAGTREPGEDPAATAARELTEETGYTAGRIEPLAAFYLSPGILDERMLLFLAKDLSAGTPRREPGERIENYVVLFREALEMIRDGQIQDAKTITGLLWYERWVATTSADPGRP